MPTRRKRITRTPAEHITPGAVAAFVARDYATLHVELRMRPWEISPLDADGLCPYTKPCAGADSWKRAQQLRKAIEAQLTAAQWRALEAA